MSKIPPLREDVKDKIAPIMAGELDKIRKRVYKKDLDWVAVVDGEEGVGKSVLAQQIAAYLDPEFNLDRIVFHSDDFMDLIKSENIKKGSCIVLDEAFNAANSRSALTEVNRAMIGVATEMRQRNLFIILVLPTFFDLDRYFALWRCKTLIHVYFTPKQERRYIVFPKSAKKYLYLNGKKFYNYNKPKSPLPAFKFPKYYVVDEYEYRLKKSNAFKGRAKLTASQKKWVAQRDAYIKFIYQILNISQKKISEIPKDIGYESPSRHCITHVVQKTPDFKDVKVKWR